MGKGKGKGGASAPVYQPVDPTYSLRASSDLNRMMLQMSQSNAQFLQSIQAMNDQAFLQKLPELAKTPDVDWSTQEKELISKAKADYQTDQAKKFGRNSTLISSPLLDDEEAETTSLSLI